MEVTLENKVFNVEIQRKRIKNIYLKIKKENELIVSAHPLVPLFQIENFLLSKKEWIIEANERVKKKSSLNENKGTRNQKIQYLGEIKDLEIVASSKPALKVEPSRIVLYIKDISKAQVTFENLAKKELKKYCDQYQNQFNLIMDDYHLPHPTVSFRKMVSKWGSCIPKKAKITMNVNLIYMPLECLYYVLLHEYSHMIVPNHSKRFYDLIEMYMPDYKRFRKMLREK